MVGRTVATVALAVLWSCVQDGSFETARGRQECAAFAASDDLDTVGCDESVAETWRCAVSAAYWRDADGEPAAISQVCRWTAHRGETFWAWRTYTLFPADCGTCTGKDPMIPDGCEPAVDRELASMPECAPYEEEDPGLDDTLEDDVGADADPQDESVEDDWTADDEDADVPEDAPAEDLPDLEAGAVHPGVVGADGVAAFDALSLEARAALAGRRLFWGHQSVGDNLIAGSASLGYGWSGVWSGSDYDGTHWGHGTVEDNGDPWRKIRSFGSFLRDAGIGARVDAAAFKFCWIDFEPDTDVDALVDAYDAALADLSNDYPAVRFLHVTTPLTSDDAERNAVRWRYGRRLIDEHSASGVVLDLAAIESTDSNGQPCTLGGARRLCDEWRDDEGHMNDRGSAHAAKAFLYAFSRLF
jgi:hypothetical protein